MIFLQNENDFDEDEHRFATIKRRKLRDNSNPLELPQKEFSKNFRIKKECLVLILESVKFPECRSQVAIPPILQLCASLNLLASGGYEVNIGNNKSISMAQTTVSKVFRKTIQLLEKEFCPRWIKLEESKFDDSKRHFYDKFKLPGIVGCVDGTHIPILKPRENEHIFFGRRGFHSLNVMLICNHLNEIIAVNASHGGAAHDSTVWTSSNENTYFHRKFDGGDTSTRILGDSGYALQPWLLTPYRNAGIRSRELRFNNIHAKARCKIECTIGILKGRWRCLSSDRKLRFQPKFVTSIINVCVALHNLCIHYNVNFDNNMQTISNREQAPDCEEHNSSTNYLLRRAQIIRDSIRDSL